jgi:hypothetical protein
MRNVTFLAYKKYDDDDIYNVTSSKNAILNGISLRNYNFRIYLLSFNGVPMLWRMRSGHQCKTILKKC